MKKDEPPPPEDKPPPPPEIVAAPPPPKGFQVLTAPIKIPDVLPEIDLSKKMTDEADFSGKGVAGGIAKGVVGGTGPVTDQTYFEFQVEKQVDVATWGSVVAEGIFEELTEPGERELALRLMAKAWPVAVPPEATGIVYRLRLTTKTGRFIVSEPHDPA